MFEFSANQGTHPCTDSAEHGASRLDILEMGQGYLDQIERLLRDTLALNPNNLSSYFALYKLLFRQSRLAEAERVARLALAVSARLGYFAPAWQRHTPATAHWADTHSPAHFHLFTLKALSFILLRQGRINDSLEILVKLEEIDPADLVGGSVIRSYAQGCMAAPTPQQSQDLEPA
ncbi:MAG: hypothetical protein ACYCY3_11530 [Halothiobacillus sp.]